MSELNTRIKHKRDTSANWTSKDPVLLNGELILVDTAEGDLRFKIGDGTKKYTQLPFTDEVILEGISELRSELDAHKSFSTIEVSGQSPVSADSAADTLNLAAGDNVTITTDPTNDKVTISARDTVYTHPSHTPRTSGLYKITVDGQGHVNGASAVEKSDITDLGIPAQDTTYNEATQSAAGLMSSGDKKKVDGIEDGANKTIVDEDISGTSTNPVQNQAVSAALNNKLDKSLKGVANGVAELDAQGRVPSSQLPAYVDDVIEGTYLSSSSFRTSTGITLQGYGESGKIYVDTTSNKTYRWSGSAFVEISASLALGTTSSTAYRGDHGKTAYDHSQITTGNPHGTTKSDLGLGNVENKSSETIRSELTSDDITNALDLDPLHVLGPGMPIVPFTTEDGHSFWTQRDFVPTDNIMSGQVPVMNESLEVVGGYAPVSKDEPPAYGQTLIRKMYEEEANNGVPEYKSVYPILSVNNKKVWHEYGSNGIYLPIPEGNFADYVPKSYLENSGILSKQTSSPPIIDVTSYVAVAHGNGVMVAIAPNTNVAAVKADGGVWESVNLPLSQRWIDIAYGDIYGSKVFIAVAIDSGILAISEDGYNWDTVDLEFPQPWWSITYYNQQFIITSPDTGICVVNMDYPYDPDCWVRGSINNLEYHSMFTSSDTRLYGYAGDDFISMFDAYTGYMGAILLPDYCTDVMGIAYGSGILAVSCKYQNQSAIVYASPGVYAADNEELKWDYLQVLTMNGDFSYNWDSISYGNGRFIITSSEVDIAGLLGCWWIVPDTSEGYIEKYDFAPIPDQYQPDNTILWSDFVDGQFVIALSSGAFLYSLDGKTWTDTVDVVSAASDELISVEDIDSICGTTLLDATISEVKF